MSQQIKAILGSLAKVALVISVVIFKKKLGKK